MLTNRWFAQSRYLTYSYSFFLSTVNQTFVGSRWKKKNLQIATDCMEHALISAHPHSRYAAGRDSKFFFIPLSYLPTLLTDYILTYGHPRPAKSLYWSQTHSLYENQTAPTSHLATTSVKLSQWTHLWPIFTHLTMHTSVWYLQCLCHVFT